MRNTFTSSVIEMGRMSDYYTIRPKPNSWPSSPNEYRIYGWTWPNIVSSRKNFGIGNCGLFTDYGVIFSILHI